MTKDSWFDNDVIIQGAAHALGLRGSRGLRSAIVRSSVERIQGWAEEFGIAFTGVEDVLELVKNQTRVETVRVESDEQLAEIARQYSRDVATRQVQLEFEFNRMNTEALVFQRDQQARSAPKFVAVVDARGDRVNRAWFGERHEPTHLLIRDPSTGLVWRRRGADKPTPVERLVDDVASEIGFWAPFVEPLVREELRRGGPVLEAFERLRAAIAPEASRAASYRAFARYVETPLLIVYCKESCRKADEKLGRLSGSWALRVADAIESPSARRESLFIPDNYRIPTHSCIHSSVRSGLPLVEDDNLWLWTDSSGSRRPAVRVRVYADGAWACLEVR